MSTLPSNTVTAEDKPRIKCDPSTFIRRGDLPGRVSDFIDEVPFGAEMDEVEFVIENGYLIRRLRFRSWVGGNGFETVE